MCVSWGIGLFLFITAPEKGLQTDPDKRPNFLEHHFNSHIL
jgi:hypothetical protein